MNEITQLADRYVAIWHEPDAEQRRRSVAQLWQARKRKGRKKCLGSSDGMRTTNFEGNVSKLAILARHLFPQLRRHLTSQIVSAKASTEKVRYMLTSIH
jgi:hypothetical protein